MQQEMQQEILLHFLLLCLVRALSRGSSSLAIITLD
jgi:hypothetical protein